MQDEFQKLFVWIGAMDRPAAQFFAAGSQALSIVTAFKSEWGKRDTPALLKDLDARYGEAAGEAVEEYIRRNILLDWPEVGKKAAHEGTEIEDFIRILWGPLPEQGFGFSVSRAADRVTFCVTKCPIHALAQQTGMHEWLYRLACSTDFHTAGAFSARIGFERTKTLMQGHDCCNHQYFYTRPSLSQP
jgi:predicted ArsR family transcriptional regulator